MKSLAEKTPPGAKLLFLLLSVIVALYFNNLILLATMNAAMLPICVVFSNTFREILSVVRRIALGMPFLILIFVASEWAKAGNWAAASIMGFKGAAVFILKLHFVLWVNLFLVYTSEPRDVVRSLRKLRTPRELCIMIVIILRFFPVMFDEAVAVYQAQHARGFELRRLLNPSNWLPLAVPLVVNVMKKSHDLAITMELKGIFDTDRFGAGRDV